MAQLAPTSMMRWIVLLTLLQTVTVRALPYVPRAASTESIVLQNIRIEYIQVDEGCEEEISLGIEIEPGTVGTVYTALNTTRHQTSQPFPTSVIPSPTVIISPVPVVESTTIVSTTSTTTTRITIGGSGSPASTAPVGGGSSAAVAASSAAPAASFATVGNSSSMLGTLAGGNNSVISGSSNLTMASNIFVPVDTIAPPINSRPDHPQPRLGIIQTTPIETNKFYANFFLGNQTNAAWTHPYSVSWSRGSGNAKSYGLAISQIERSQLAYGPQNPNVTGDPVQYFINPVGIQSMILSATTLGSSTALSMDSLEGFSANLNMLPQVGASPAVKFPLVQGMAFVTGVYNGATPQIQSSVFFNTFTPISQGPRAGIYKYRVLLEDGTNWLIYATPSNGGDPGFQMMSNSNIQGVAGFTGTIQVAKNPSNATGESIFDASAGVYPITAGITGSVDGATGSYALTWTKGGIGANAIAKRQATGTPSLLMFALPHHIESLSNDTANGKTTIKLETTTKGLATAVVGDSWTLVEPDLPTDMGFAPWSPTLRSINTLSASAINLIQSVGASEISQNMTAQTDLNSMYFSGKGLSKFASIVYTLHDLANDPGMANAGLENLKSNFSLFVNNHQQFPLVYETAWKGVVSTASYTLNDGGAADFGNTYYNDHHFHYGYFIHTAAVIGYLDPSWIPANKDWVNILVRDIANPSTLDTYFPFSRSFDWYHGHSWAKGLFDSGDGKDEESSSEDAMAAYAIKMWGKVIGDPNMEARGNLQLKVLSRSLQNYFLMESTNTNQPPNFIANKVTGILFENKIDHSTYFGLNPEYIEGIHMIPLEPFSTLTRTQNFVTEEWNSYFATSVDQVAGGWRSILYANYAIINAKASWKFFANSSFDPNLLDGGASRTWYLAYAAGLGGASS
ncbi:MAG: hypothetical protein M1827_005570 [Pycnora praestabilis]|nr:MAG: hypothetical protein M1827_005570 [Pycnora praestabilis]